MNNMTTKELLTALPKYKSHKTVRASKIKDIEIIALMDVVLFCNIEVVEPEGVKSMLIKYFCKNTDQKLADIWSLMRTDLCPIHQKKHLKKALVGLTTSSKMGYRSALKVTMG